MNWYERYFGEGTVVVAENCTVVKDRSGRTFVAGSPDWKDKYLPEDEQHNCDAMGCASAGPHIIGVLKEQKNEKAEKV